MASTIKRKIIKSRCHVVIPGSLVLSGYAQVGGDLLVEGDLRVDGPLLCLGRLTVKGSLRAGDVIVGRGMEISGDMDATSVDARGDCGMKTDLNEVAQRIACWIPGLTPSDEKIDTALDWISDEATLCDLQEEFLPPGPAIKVGGRCTVAGWVRVIGSVQVGSHFNPDDCSVTSGNVCAETVLTEGDLDCGGLYARRWVMVQGDLRCAVVECSQLETWGIAEADETIVATGGDTKSSETSADGPYRSLELANDHAEMRDVVSSIRCGTLKAGAVTAGGSILVEGPIDCAGYLRASRSITSGGTITTGRQFGILAGLDVARPKWLTVGYVCAKAKPPRIRTGTYRTLAKRRTFSDPKPARLK